MEQKMYENVEKTGEMEENMIKIESRMEKN